MKPTKVLVSGEHLYLVKSKFFGWGIVYPNRNEDGSWNWKNFLVGGSYIKFFIMVAIVLIVTGFFFEHASIVQIANDCLQQLNNPWYLRT